MENYTINQRHIMEAVVVNLSILFHQRNTEWEKMKIRKKYGRPDFFHGQKQNPVEAAKCAFLRRRKLRYAPLLYRGSLQYCI